MREHNNYIADTDAALQKHSEMVYKIALTQTKNRYDADDVFQEVFLRLVQHSDKIVSEEHLKAWLIRVTINCCKKHFKLWNTKASELLDDTAFIMPEEHDVFYAVLELPNKYKMIIHLFYYEELSVKEISDLLNIKESTIKTRLFRGREILKKKLEGGFGENEQYV